MLNTMIATNRSDLSSNRNNNNMNNNNNLSQLKCRQSRHKKRSNNQKETDCSVGRLASTEASPPSPPLTTLSRSSSSGQTVRKRVMESKGNNYYTDRRCKTSIVKTKLFKVKNSAKDLNYWTHSLSNGLTHCFKSINSWTNYRPLCYLIELIGRCCRPWIKSNKAIAEESLISRLPYEEAIRRKSSPTQQSCKKVNNNNNNNKSSYVSSLSLSPIFNMYSPLLALTLLISFVFRIAEACSSRSTPKPRPPSPTTRPNITFQTYACPEAYAKWYCLNGATCFSVRIGESILYNCECADGYMGQRCEFKDLDGSYLPSREKVLVETASIAGGVTVAVLLMVFISVFYYTYLRHRKKEKRMSSVELDMDEVDRKPFARVNSLKNASKKSVSYNCGQDDSNFPESKRLQDLECGDNLVQYLFRPVVITAENCDQNHDK